MSERLSDHLTTQLSLPPTESLCEDYHFPEMGVLLNEFSHHKIELRRRLGAAVQPTDVIVDGEAVSLAQKGITHIGHTLPSAHVALEHWARTDTEGVRIAAERDVTELGVGKLLAAHENAQPTWSRLSLQASRIKRLADLALDGGDLVVRTFHARMLGGGKAAYYDGLRQRPGHAAGSSLSMNEHEVRLDAHGGARPDRHVHIGDMHPRRIGNLWYRMPGLVVDVAEGVHDVIKLQDNKRLPLNQKELGTVYPRAIHERLQELTFVIEAIQHGMALVEVGTDVQFDGPRLRHPVKITV